jgi:hypothetical protein
MGTAASLARGAQQWNGWADEGACRADDEGIGQAGMQAD